MLAASAIAFKEESPSIPDTPTDEQQLARELREVSEKLNALELLGGLHLMAYSAKRAYKEQKPAAAYLVTLDMRDPHKMRTQAKPYGEQEMGKANQDYVNCEKEFFGDPKQQVLLVSVDKVADLEPAYPAYFMHAKTFVWEMARFIGE